MSYRDGMVLDTRQLDRLAVELDSRSYAVGFVSRFLEHLPDRLTCVHQSLFEGKSEGALAAIRSVATSAAMAGAIQLESQSRAVEGCIRAGDLEAALAAAGELDSTAADFARHLDALLGSPGHTPASRGTHPES